MALRNPRNLTLETALAEAEQRYAVANPVSRARHEAACAHLPGGNTRSILHFSPFPLSIVHGEGARLRDADGHDYVDFLSEYTAGLYGHSHPVIVAAVQQALAGGIVLGGPNAYEAELAALMCARFPSLDMVRFCNSGTEANLNAFCAARAVTGRSHILVFEGAYHGGVFYYGPAGSAMNAPFPTVIAPYNDLEGTALLIERHKDQLAAVVLEPMLGAGGAIPAELPFLEMLREVTRRHGIVLIFDEVMTSRLSPGGLQARLGVLPDLTTFGKYLGGGLTFGAFGGTAEIMQRFDPRRADAFAHSGTYNNNVLSMAAGVAGLKEAFTPEAAVALNERADSLRERLNAICRKHGVAMQVLGLGSINCVHFHDRPVRRPGDAAADPRRNALFHLEMLERGVYMARRGFIATSLPLEERDYETFATAFEDVVDSLRPLLLESA
jgi:glutamate-1-semialdehyde 2,1-aminomutase